mgnify:CR=1 FL=1
MAKRPAATAIVIGRFQPFHNGHLAIVKYAAANFKKIIIVLGSCNNARTKKNVWYAQERIHMILNSLSKQIASRVSFIESNDYPDDKDWESTIKESVNEIHSEDSEITILGHYKDESSYYLNIFPYWHLSLLPSFFEGLNSTDIREAYFSGITPDPAYLPSGTIDFLHSFRQHKDYATVKKLFMK